jgi:uncharacterized protein with von Willebrand factor type A (vWA) domain
MERIIEGFVVAARTAGVRISISETLDAVRAVKIVGYRERPLLKDAFAVTLAKTAAEKTILEDCFERFFAFPFFPAPSDRAGRDAPPPRISCKGNRPWSACSWRKIGRASSPP